ncbi:flavin reductase family protein [Xanthobacter autotrophicus]|uniref:flavin reductase family protein n=1 Tax=Xanthobacter autotrophicus TaxID=280 RepID=UPI00372C86FD
MAGSAVRSFRDACGLFATGVTVVTTGSGEAAHGMTANAFMSVSLAPPLVAISVAETARICPRIQDAHQFAVSVLPRDAERTAWHFAGKPSPGATPVFCDLNGFSVISGAAAAFTCDLEQDIAAGDHRIFVGRVRALRRCSALEPLVFHRSAFAGVDLSAIKGLHVEEEDTDVLLE